VKEKAELCREFNLLFGPFFVSYKVACFKISTLEKEHWMAHCDCNVTEQCTVCLTSTVFTKAQVGLCAEYLFIIFKRELEFISFCNWHCQTDCSHEAGKEIQC